MMSSKVTITLQNSGWQKVMICCILLFTCTLCISNTAAQVGSAPPDQNGEQPQGLGEQQRRKTPPKAAREACEGKSEGDPCSFKSPEGIRTGECLSGREDIFACRPHPETQPDAGSGGPPPRPQEYALPPVPPQKNSEVHTPPLQESKRSPKAVSAQDTSTVQTAPQTPVQSEDKKTENHQIQTQLPGQTPSPAAIITRVGLNRGGLGSYLVVAIAVAGITWYIFFRYSTVPLRRLRKVTQKLAGGDLSARVGEGLIHRKDEVADLGRDVDRMAERTESLVSAHQRLIRDVSHELRSPLARLNVALELARQSAGMTHAAPFDRIERESDRLNELIGQLLMLTKLESENSINKRSDVDIASLISEIAQDADFEAKSHDRRVRAECCSPLIINGSRELLRQALENLLRNAVRYTAEGTTVEICLSKSVSRGHCWAHIEVRDWGPGVPESELLDIFRPFYRVGDARERQSGGAGVGLAISDRAVRLHGGRLRAINAAGGGLIMEMELPLD